jgi:hypothetical protein
LLEEHRRLATRYEALRDARNGPVFFIEHGLDEAEIAALVADVRSAVQLHSLDGGWWDAHKLPLIVAATEVGYRYRGAGTNFWPLLEEEIGAHIGDPARQRIRDRFAAAATVYRGAQPPATPWAQAFHLIAWPITHALVPLEFHRPLALTLANLRENVTDFDDESVYRAIRIASASSSARFSTLLSSQSLVVSVVRSLLGTESGELSPEITQRIKKDLEADHLARRSLTAARQAQRLAPKVAKRRTPSTEVVPSISGALQLRRRENALVLEASFPPVDAQVSSRLRKALRRRRFAPKLWGVTTPVPSEQLLSGLPFSVKLGSAPSVDAELLPRLEMLDIDAELRAILESFELRLEPPLLFAVGADKEIARRVHGPSISGHRAYWVLTSAPSPAMAQCPKLGEVGPYTCYALDPAIQDQCDTLEQLGYMPRFGVSVAFAGSPAVDRDASTPAFAEGDQRIIVPRHSHPEGLFVEWEGNATRLGDDEVVRVVVPTGDHVLKVRSGGESREFAFSGISVSGPYPLAACTIDAQSELTVQALMNGSLAFSIESYAPLEQLDLTVDVEAAGTMVSASVPLAPLPQVITSKHEPFASLLDDETRELLLQTPNPVLHLRVGHLCSGSWALERRVRPCWWVRGSNGDIVLMSELGALPYGVVAATEPHLPPTPGLDPLLSETSLLAPVGLEGSEYGAAAHFTTLCVAPRAASLEAPGIPKPRLRRRRRAEPGSAGLEDLAEGFLRWSLAETDTVTAEIRRRQITDKLDGWITELCCGTIWHERESELTNMRPWELLVEVGHAAGLGRDGYLSLPDHVWRESLQIAVGTIRHEIPHLLSLARPPSDLAKHDWTMIWTACDNAYQSLRRTYQATGNTEIVDAIAEADASADFDPEAWQTVFEQVLAETDYATLAALLLPTDVAPGFMALDPSRMSLADFGEELHRWAKESQKALAGDLPNEETLRAIVAFWTEPEVAVSLDWRGALQTMISERPVARAARYLALRRRQVRREGAE